MPEIGQDASTQDLQFQTAEPLPAENSADPSAQRCVVCKQPIGATYFHAQGQVVCPMCAERIQSGQQKAPRLSLGRAFLYGAAAALAGSILYALVAIVLNLEIGIVAIVIGVMVGKAIRHASHGRGGRPQQILAVLLTYFAITSSYVPVILYQRAKHPAQFQQAVTQGKKAADRPVTTSRVRPGLGTFVAAMIFLLLIVAAAPFFALTAGISGLISLFIIFIGLRQAWKLTGRTELLVMGPYETAPAQ